MPGHIKKPGQITIRISDQGKWCLIQLQHFHGLSQTGIIEQLLRKEAREAGFTPPTEVGEFIEIVEPERQEKAQKKG